MIEYEHLKKYLKDEFKAHYEEIWVSNQYFDFYYERNGDHIER